MNNIFFEDSLDPISRVWSNDNIFPSLSFSESKKGLKTGKMEKDKEKSKKTILKRQKREE